METQKNASTRKITKDEFDKLPKEQQARILSQMKKSKAKKVNQQKNEVISDNEKEKDERPIHLKTLDELPKAKAEYMVRCAEAYMENFALISQTLMAVDEKKAQDILLQAGETPLFKVSGVRNKAIELGSWTNETFDIFMYKIVMSGKILEEEHQFVDKTLERANTYIKAKNKAYEYLDLHSGTYDFNLSFKANNFRCHLISATPKGLINEELVTRQVTLNIRVVPKTLPNLDSLNLPLELNSIFEQDSGLILVAGSTGDGKSTTVASIINTFNLSDDKVSTILTIEEPIEFIHNNKNAYIIQRNLATLPKEMTDNVLVGDVSNYEKATEDALREDCDIVMIGELRTESAMHNALRLVEAGKLVIASIHGKSVPDTIEKFLSEFGANVLEKTRSRLASNLLCILHQNLVIKDAKQYPLAGLLYIDNNRDERQKFKNLMLNGDTDKFTTELDAFMNNSSKCVTAEKRFNQMVQEGIFNHSDKDRFF